MSSFYEGIWIGSILLRWRRFVGVELAAVKEPTGKYISPTTLQLYHSHSIVNKDFLCLFVSKCDTIKGFAECSATCRFLCFGYVRVIRVPQLALTSKFCHQDSAESQRISAVNRFVT